MRAKIIPGIAVAGAAVAAMVAASSPAGAGASTPYLFVGYAGGSLVRAADNTITSDLTAASNLNNSGLVSDQNSAARVTASTLLKAGAANTSTVSRAVSGGYEIVSESKTAGVSLLNGAITATAIDTVSTARVVNGKVSGSTNTSFIGLKIAGTKVPVNIPPNWAVGIPGLATIIVNFQAEQQDATRVMTYGIGLYVGLLRAQGDNTAGASVLVAPTYAALGPLVPPSGHATLGKAYGTAVTANVGTLVNVASDPTAPISLAAGGTKGVTQTSSVAGVNLTPLAKVGAVTDSINGTNTTAQWDAKTSSRVAAINLFNGAIRADAITAYAHVHGAPSTPTAVSGNSKLVNLVIGGKVIPLNTAPNTVINLGLGKITINQQIKTGNKITVRALDIVLGKAGYGLPAGAEVQVAVAIASVS